MSTADGEVCIANIGPLGRRRRMVFGVVASGLGWISAALLVGLHADRLWRLLLFLPFWIGGSGIFQATGHT